MKPHHRKEPGIWKLERKGGLSYFVLVSKRIRSPIRTTRVYRQGYAHTLLEARKLKNSLTNRLNELSPAGIRATFSHAVEEYLEHLKYRRTPSVLYRETSCIKKHLLPGFGERLLRDISVAECQRLLDLASVGKSSQTYKHLRNYLRAIFEYVRLRGWIATNPADCTEIRPIKRKDPQVLSELQARKLLQHLREKDRTVFYHVALALYTCCRAGELRALTFASVNFEARTITISQTFDPQTGRQDRTKNWQSRIVPINVELMRILKELWLQADENELASVLPPWREFDNNEQAKILKKFCRELRIPEIRFHDLRATGITLLLDKGVSVPKVMKIAGHKRLSSTEVYLRLSGVDNRGATDALQFGIFNP